MAKLGAWLKKHLHPKLKPKNRSSDQPPFFSSTRRPITSTSLDTPMCLFFELPGDIRSIILTMAFGGQTLHVDIVHQDKTWQWRGAVCNRNPPGLLPSMQHIWFGPLSDKCLELACGQRERTLESYRISIMGFLLSCRQAYTEGIEFLYSTNRFSIKSEVLLLHLPQLILPKRLACIKALEIVIMVHRIPQEDGTSSLNVDHLKPILDHIATHCHSLRSVNLSFADQNWGHKTLTDLTLPLIDAFYHSMQLRSMTVDLPAQPYGAVSNSRSLDHHPRETPPMGRFPRCLWRSLDGEAPVVQSRSIEGYPYPPLKLPVFGDEDESTESAGYWLSVADQLPFQPYMVCF